MSMVASACHHPMDGLAGWNVQLPAQAVAAASVLPPPRSYYVVSWVPRALPEVVQLIKDLPSDHERCLINKHFELGMLVMRRCGVQNPEEIKCLLDGFREGTTRLSAKESVKSPSQDPGSVGKSQADGAYSSGFCCSPIERRKLLIFFNDHRASRPWVLCPAKHCIKSARTTGKVKGRVKIFQYDQRSASVKIPKLFLDCLSDFLTRDQYVFATFCPQQKYTDHELDWFALQSRRQAGFPTEPGGDVIFRELVEDHDTKGTRVWPFEDYIIFSNSQAKIVAVFKKKQPLITLYRHSWPNKGEDCSSMTMMGNPFAPTINGGCPQPNPLYMPPTGCGEIGEDCHTRSSLLTQDGTQDADAATDITKKEVEGRDASESDVTKDDNLMAPAVLTSATSTTTSIGYGDEKARNDSLLDTGNFMISGKRRCPSRYSRRRTTAKFEDPDENDPNQDDSDEYSDPLHDADEDHDLSESEFPSSQPRRTRSKYKGARSSGGQISQNAQQDAMNEAVRGMQQMPNPFGGMVDCQSSNGNIPGCHMGGVISPTELIRQAEEAEHLLVRIMTRVLARLEPLDDPSGLDLGVYTSSVSASSMERQSSN